MMKTIVIYPGRFQPFGPHHFKSYDWLSKIFGKENVFIATSNKTDENSPLTFKEKELCIAKYIIDQTKIVQVKNPYKADEIVSKFDPNETSVIYAYGQKDFGRIHFTKKDGSESYLKEYYGQKNLKPLSECGYVLELPHISLSAGGSEISGTYLRSTLPMCTQVEFQRIMGYYDPLIHNLFKKEFHPDIIEMVESILVTEGNRITKTQLQRIEQYADNLFREFGIDVNFQDIFKGTHFYDRLNDPRNETPITSEELRQIFRKASKKFGHKLGTSNHGIEGVLYDMETDVNLPFVIKFDAKNRELDLVPKTIMKKKGFKSSTPIFAMESTQVKKFSKHIQHPYEADLTCTELKEFVSDVCGGIAKGSIKYDGYNLQMTFQDKQFKAARNKSNIKKPMSREELKEKYSENQNAQTVFLKAFDDMVELMREIPFNDLMNMFEGGRTFINFEVLHPLCRNIFKTTDPLISIHSMITYDENGNEIRRETEVPIFISQNLDNYKKNTFDIQLPTWYELKPNNFQEIEMRFHSIFDEFQKISGSEHILDWEKEELRKQVLKFGNIIIQDFCKKNPQNSENIKRAFKMIGEVDPDKCNEVQLERYRKSMKELTYLGGYKSINPIEGFVIPWKNRLMKLTGCFGVLTLIFGIYIKNNLEHMN